MRASDHVVRVGQTTVSTRPPVPNIESRCNQLELGHPRRRYNLSRGMAPVFAKRSPRSEHQKNSVSEEPMDDTLAVEILDLACRVEHGFQGPDDHIPKGIRGWSVGDVPSPFDPGDGNNTFRANCGKDGGLVAL